ncbi:hypothetical protein PIB30_049124 [Stylosanthes scabra]|uniref:F-box associated domain-containing protein n=1 Tax=Stylosanthes scabra TaxID=79078 RepID=A0ABU6VG47_9FABA|nr:hypothetical protein [Stylosanthes scabra]
MRLPFTISDFGWWNFVGTDNGIVCMRYSLDGAPSQMMLWNPLTNRTRRINDPGQATGLHAVCSFSFGYNMPRTDQYFVIHAHKRRFRDKKMEFTYYDSKKMEWKDYAIEDKTIQKLGGHNDKVFIWKLDTTAKKKRLWQLAMTLDPIRFGCNPTLFVEDFLFLTLENSSNLNRINDRKITEISINKSNIITKNTSEIFYKTWIEEVELRSFQIILQGMIKP